MKENKAFLLLLLKLIKCVVRWR